MVACISCVILCVAGYSLYNIYYDRRIPNFASGAEIYVYPGMTAQDVETKIMANCRVKRPGRLRRCFASVSSVKPGHYTITTSDVGVYVARMFSAGWQSPVNLVLSGTMRSKASISRKISRQMLLDSVDVYAALSDSLLLASYGFTPSEVFALIIPDTYQVYWTDSMPRVLDRQKAAYDAFWTEENRRKAGEQGLTPMEVSVLASIVNAETNYEKEMPSIARVYLNRLHRGMKLQADPTVAYIFDYEPRRILKKHLETESPFNTYLHAGLPPAPICVPSKAALLAVLNPDSHGYLYFCASPALDGTHRFASSYSEHLRNAAAYRQAISIHK